MSTLERIKKLCENHGITVPVLEDRLNIPSNTIYQWKENGNRKPNLERLELIADYFNVSVDYLLGRTDDQEIKTIAAHMDDDLTEEEMEDIKQYIEFIKSKRK